MTWRRGSASETLAATFSVTPQLLLELHAFLQIAKLHILGVRQRGWAGIADIASPQTLAGNCGSKLALVLLSHGKPQTYAYVFEVPEGHELDDVSKDRLSLG